VVQGGEGIWRSESLLFGKEYGENMDKGRYEKKRLNGKKEKGDN
jgi:hypothetical protein